jgi:two-component system alkaline phosphatase synthesis response regulator PhoP
MDTQKKILIVDDEKDIVSLVSLHMKMAGFLVYFAYDGYTALDICKTENPDMIILDLMLPKLNGFEVCRRLKEAEETRCIPVIMLSARAETEDKLLGFNVGADDYVTKPFSPRELLARVKRVMNIQRVSRR